MCVFREAEFAEGMLQTLAQYAEQLNLKHAKAAAASAPRTAPPVATTLAIDTADIKARLHHAVTKANELAAKQLKLQHLFDRYCSVSARFVPPLASHLDLANTRAWEEVIALQHELRSAKAERTRLLKTIAHNRAQVGGAPQSVWFVIQPMPCSLSTASCAAVEATAACLATAHGV